MTYGDFMVWRLDLHNIQPGEAFSIHRFGPRADQNFPEHTHRDFHELFLVIAGQVEHRTTSGVAMLGPGSFSLIRQEDEHGLRFCSADFINLSIPMAEWRRFADYLGGALPLTALIASPQAPSVVLTRANLRTLAADLRALFRLQRTTGSRAALASVLLRWLPSLPTSTTATGPSWWLPFLATVESRLEDGFSATDLPRLAGVGREHLARSFRRHHGTTPTAWLTERRLVRAELLLAHSDRSVLDIATCLGFGSVSWFHRAFRARHGCSPHVWRKRMTASAG